MSKFGIMTVMQKPLVNTTPAPEPCFDPVPGCATCAMYVRLATRFWKLVGVLKWLEFDIAGEQHVARDHAGASEEEISSIKGFGR